MLIALGVYDALQALGLEQVDLIDPDDLCGQLQRQNRGQILVAAHLGNLEVCRALAEVGAQRRARSSRHGW